MRTSLFALLLCALAPAVSRADPPAPPAAAAPANLTGRWSVAIDSFGLPEYFTMQLTQQGDKL
jgi:hypothetical protein